MKNTITNERLYVFISADVFYDISDLLALMRNISSKIISDRLQLISFMSKDVVQT